VAPGVVGVSRPAITERELRLLRWVGEQYAAPMTLVASLLGELPTDGRLTRRAAARLQQLGYADRYPLLRRVWLVPTSAGLRAAGLPYRHWSPERHEWSARHIEACGRLRLYLERHRPDGRWESERAIRSRWDGSGARVRLADGGLWWPDGSATGVELELHIKRADRYNAAVADQDPAWTDGVWWFTPAEQMRLLASRLAAAGASRFDVCETPEGVAP
jgi:hypothetical protein